MNNRRDFVATSIAAGALLNGLLPTQALAAASAQPQSAVFPALSVFHAMQGQDLELHAAGRSHAVLQLVAVDDRSCCQRFEQFTLVLRGDAVQPVGAGIYRMAHARSGRFLMHIEPSGSDATGALYRAEITRLS